MVDCLLTILVNQICRLFSTHQTPDSIITPIDKVAHLGNDINDKEAMEAIGITFCPADAHESIIEISDHVLNTKGGDGVIRELLDLIIK